MPPTPESGGQVRPPSNKRPVGEEVVISGISGIFPSSANTAQFVDNLFNNVDMVSENDLNFDHPEAPRHLGKIDGINKFDAQFFRVPSRQARAMEPMSRKLLEQAYQAMYDSGINPLALKGQKVGVFIGSSYTDTSNVTMFNGLKGQGYVLSGCSKSMFPNRISYWIDAKGPSYGIDGGNASTMIALEHAYDAMTNGECEAAIVGGANLCLEPNLTLNMKKSGTLCLDGKTRCFDENADGAVRAEAVSCIFLQKAKDAKRIYAEVCHAKATFGIKEDFKFSSTRTPEELKQFFDEFYSEVDVSPTEVEYVEAQSSAIPEADVNELTAIEEIFAKDGSVKVGSVKSNMGHSEPASGICSLAKLCLAYHRGELPANLHFDKPTNVPALKNGKLQVVKKNVPFKRGFTAVNNFSENGTNCHALLKGHYKPKDKSKYKCELPRLMLISGRQESCINRIIEILKSQPIDPEVVGMLHNIYQFDTPGHTSRGYTILDTNEKNETVSLAENVEHYPGVKKPLWLVFSGMGSQWPGMAADLMRLPIFADAIHKCHKVLEPLGVDLIRILTEPDKKMFDNILHCFLGISAVQIGLCDVLKAIGIVPDHFIGHSQGEMCCAYWDECYTKEEMILSAYSRGIVSLESTFCKGAMAAVGLGFNNISPMCPPEIDVACHNSNESATLSGPADVLKQFVEELTAKGIFAREVPSANIAFHSRYIRHAGPTFLEKLTKIIKNRPRSEKWISTSIPEDRWDEPWAKYSSPEYHTNNLMSPVYFEEAAQHIPKDAIVVEVAPHGLLQAILKRSHPECSHISLTKRGQSDQLKYLFENLGKLYENGVNMKMDVLYPAIEYPVATETQMISHFIEWEHSEDFPDLVARVQDKVKSATRNFVMTVHDDEYKYLTGHIRNGNSVFPESAMLILTWETLARYNGVKNEEMSVIFRDVQFHGEVLIDFDEPLKLTIMINKGNDYFEIQKNGILKASGYVAETVKPDFKKFVDNEETEAVIFKSDEIYKHLHSKGFTYKGDFQSIISSNKNWTKAEVSWNDNWITFLDSVLQLNLLANKNENVSSIKIIKKLVINTDLHQKDIITKENGVNYFNAENCNISKITRCGGVELRYAIYENQSKNEIEPAAVDHLTFVPHSIINKVDIETLFKLHLQIVADNIKGDAINVTEVLNGSNKSVAHLITEAAEILLNIKVNISTVNMKELPKMAGSTDMLILLDQINRNGVNVEDIFNNLQSGTFLLMSAQNASEYQNGDFTVISSMNTKSQELVLLKKVKNFTDDEITYLSIKSDKQFSWIPKIQETLLKSKRLVLVSENQTACGLYGLVKTITKENQNKISLVIINDEQSLKFDKNDRAFRDQFRKDLVFNVLQQGQWGSYYYLPHTNNANTESFRLVNTIPGNIGSLKWSELTFPAEKENLIQVSYAGPSLKDCEQAVGLTEKYNRDFGSDFSGIDSKGNRVMGLVQGGSLASTVVADPDLLWPVPAHWSLEDAATVPLPYVHACYCLVIKGQLHRGQTVFVNGGAGAFGQAIISICLSLDCTVLTSVSDMHKKKFLLKLFPRLKENHIGCSNDGDFKDMVLLHTDFKRCDFVINCASGYSREAAMKCVRYAGGLFLDVSSLDAVHNNPIGMMFLEHDKNYMAVNLSNIFRPENINQKKILQLVIAEGIQNGTVRPISRVTYPPTSVSRAFRLLSLNKHRGRVLMKIKDGVSEKRLNIIPRISYSTKGAYIVICDETELSIDIADRLVQRGVKNIVLHMKSKSLAGYLLMRLTVWSKLGTSIKILSEPLESDQSRVQLLKEAEKLGRIQGIFIVHDSVNKETDWKQQNFVASHDINSNVVANLDIISRNNCPELSVFAVVSRASSNVIDEYVRSTVDNICEARFAVGLPALSFKIHNLYELNSDSTNKHLNPISITTALNALETALTQKQNIMRISSSIARRRTEFIDNISSSLGVNNVNEVDGTLLVKNIVMNDVNIEELRNIVKKQCKVEYTTDFIKNLSISSLRNLSKKHLKRKTNSDSGFGAFFKFVDKDECKASDAMVPMRTILRQDLKTNELDRNATHLLLIPGFEGHHQIFNTLCDLLKVQAMTLQLGPDMPEGSIQEMAASVVKEIKKSFVFKSKFYLLGYSFGVNVALEAAALLEKEGHVGIVYCLDSSPDVLRTQVDAYTGDNLTETQLQNAFFNHMFNIMTGEHSIELNNEISNLATWDDKVIACINKLKGRVTYTIEYLHKVLNSAYKRIHLAKHYRPNLSLKSELVLIKGVPHPKSKRLANDYGLSGFSKKPVKILEIDSDHVFAPEDCKVPYIVNKFLSPEDLEEYHSRDLCESYQLINPDN